MSEKIVYSVVDLRKFYGQREVLKGITLSFLDGAKIGVIGPNGAGKSTLLRILAGVDKEFEGEAIPIDGLTIGFLEQEPQLTAGKTVAENVDEAVSELRAIEARYHEVTALLGEAEGDEAEKLNDEFMHLSEEMEHKEIWELDSHLDQAKAALDLPPDDQQVDVLSGGERRRVALCKLLMSHPDFLLLDEPTNHLDADSVAWLEQHLKEYPGTVILITHDRYFLDNVVGWMLEVERGKGRPYEGNYSDYLEARQKALDTKRQADAKLDKSIQREREWLGRGAAARTSHNKARIQRYKEMVERRKEDYAEEIELRIPPGDRLGDKVIELREVCKAYGDKVLMKDLTFDLPPGAILGVVGANGMGKSTMLRMILGQEGPDSGEITIGPTVKLTYLDQSRMVLDDSSTVYENITEGNELIPFGSRTIDGRAYVARFNFRGEDQQKLLGECSGGMRNRVLLARMLRHSANVILLDEPTNDLDLDTLRVLENYVNFHHGTYESYVEWREEWRDRMGFPPESQAGRYRKFRRK
jgi:ATP-binding cassette ChvD family protein